MNKIIFPVGYFPDPTQAGPLALGSFYIGDADAADPSASQKTVTSLQEDGTTVTIAQPIDLSAGGVPLSTDGTEYPSLFVEGTYSMQVYDEPSGAGSQIYYIPNSNILGDQYRMITVTDAPYNATGDGVTDDRAAIQLAIDTMEALSTKDRGTIFFPRGKYIVGTPGLNIQSSSINIQGGRVIQLNYSRKRCLRCSSFHPPFRIR